MTALIGYARTSKADGSQVIDFQRDALAKAGVDLEHHLYTDAASGTRDVRSGLDACTKALRHGDTLVVWKLDQLEGDLRHLVNLVGDLTKRHRAESTRRRGRVDRHHHRQWPARLGDLGRTRRASAS